jgi:hypothetical protein
LKENVLQAIATAKTSKKSGKSKTYHTAEDAAIAFFEAHDKHKKFTAKEISVWTEGQYPEATIRKTEIWKTNQFKHKHAKDNYAHVHAKIRKGFAESNQEQIDENLDENWNGN